jgi:hypothetical protein
MDGVQTGGITCSLEDKTVVVKYNPTDETNPQMMLEKLQKWSEVRNLRHFFKLTPCTPYLQTHLLLKGQRQATRRPIQ